MSETILTEIDRGVGIITLNRAERHNAFDDALIRELSRRCRRWTPTRRARGGALQHRQELLRRRRPQLDEARRRLQRRGDAARRARLAGMLRLLNEMNKPTIARVQGPAYGGGVGLVAACDIAIAAFDAQFALRGQARHHPGGDQPLRHRAPSASARRAATCRPPSAFRRRGLPHRPGARDRAGRGGARRGGGEIVDDPARQRPLRAGRMQGADPRRRQPADHAEVVVDTAQPHRQRVRASARGPEGLAAFLEAQPAAWIAQGLSAADAEPTSHAGDENVRQDPHCQPRRDRLPRHQDRAPHGHQAPSRCIPTPTPPRATCAWPTRRC
jgi:methylglutaconyl-CoA hydratase